MLAAPAPEKSPTSGIKRPLLEVDLVDQLGDEEVEIRVALPVRVAGQVHRHTVDREREVGAVIEVEPAQEVLVRLAVPRVLGDDHAGDGLEQLAAAEQRQILEVDLADGPLRGADGVPQQILGTRPRTTTSGICVGAVAPAGGIGVTGAGASGAGASSARTADCPATNTNATTTKR